MAVKLVNGELTFVDEELTPAATPMAVGSGAPLSLATTGLGAPQRAAVQNDIEQTNTLLNEKILAANRRPKVDMQTTLVDSLVALAPSIMASAFLDRNKYGGIIGKSGSDALGTAYKNRESIIEGDMNAARAEAQIAAQQLGRLQQQEQALELEDLRGQYRVAQANAFGASRGDNQPVSEPVAVALSSEFGIDLNEARGLTAKQAEELRRIKTQATENKTKSGRLELEKNKFETILEQNQIFGTQPIDPTQTIPLNPNLANRLKKDVVEPAFQLDSTLEQFDNILKTNGNVLTGDAAGLLAALQAKVVEIQRKQQNTGASLTANEKTLLEATAPIAASADPARALQRRLMQRDGPNFIAGLRRVNSNLLNETLQTHNLQFPGGVEEERARRTTAVAPQAPAQFSGGSGILSDAQRQRLAELRAKRR